MKSMKETYDECISKLSDMNIRPIFKPSKTSQNCVNFIKLEEELLLLSVDVNEDISDLFKIIYILINTTAPSREECITYLYNTCMKDLEVSNISIGI
jgi:hypothetical protein